MDKIELKERLINTGCFEDGEWLDKYIELIVNETHTEEDCVQSHHILPRSLFKYLGQKIDNSQNNRVDLGYRNHILAHYYLCRAACNIQMSKANLRAVKYMMDVYKDDIDEQFILSYELDMELIAAAHELTDEEKVVYAERLRYNNKKWREEHPEEFRRNQYLASQGNWGSKRTEEQKYNISQSKLIYFDTHVSYLYGQTKETSEACRKLSEAAMGHEVSAEVRKTLSDFVTGLIGITNGTNNLLCREWELDYYAQFGYRKGNNKNVDKNRKLITITNNDINHAVTPDELYLWDNGDWMVGDRRNKRRTPIKEFIEKGFKRC